MVQKQSNRTGDLGSIPMPNRSKARLEKGVPTTWIVEKWKNLMFVLQKIVTCEGWYAVTFLDHIRLLFHFEWSTFEFSILPLSKLGLNG
jgi:hypothetical protein